MWVESDCAQRNKGSGWAYCNVKCEGRRKRKPWLIKLSVRTSVFAMQNVQKSPIWRRRRRWSTSKRIQIELGMAIFGVWSACNDYRIIWKQNMMWKQVVLSICCQRTNYITFSPRPNFKHLSHFYLSPWGTTQSDKISINSLHEWISPSTKRRIVTIIFHSHHSWVISTVTILAPVLWLNVCQKRVNMCNNTISNLLSQQTSSINFLLISTVSSFVPFFHHWHWS